jgi:glycosyltransferase involved in cell wall biosynthesis
MKVCLITGEFPPIQGGVGDFTNELGKALADKGVEVSVITSTKGQKGEYPLSISPVIKSWDWSSWRIILEIVEELKPHILHIQYQTAAYGMHPAINFLPLRLRLTAKRPKVVVTFHDLRVPYLFPKASRVRWWVNLALALWSDATIVTNEEDLVTLSSYSSITPLAIVPIGSNIAPSPPKSYDRDGWRFHLGVGSNDLLLSYFGFLNDSKGVETLILALDKLIKEQRFSVNPWLLMVGGKVGSSDPTNIAYLRKIEALIEELDVSSRVLWTGYVPQEEVSANLLASDVCVLPYRDGASLRRGTLMAAFAHGLAIVSTNRSDGVTNGELKEGGNIVLVPPDDPEALAEAIADLAKRPALRRKLGEGAKRLAQMFSWESIAIKTLEVYERILSSA